MKTKQKKRNTIKFRKTKIHKIHKSQKPFSWSNVSSTEVNIIYGQDVKSLNRKVKIPFVSTVDNLPIVHLNDVIKYINSQKVVERGCHSNSVMLSSMFPQIKTIHGYVGIRMTDVQLDFLIQQLPMNSQNFIKVDDKDSGILFYDIKRKMRYFSHSWNEIAGVHFDLTKSLNELFSKKWWNYYPTEIVDLSKIEEKQLDRIFKLTSIDKNQLVKKGWNILNSPQLKFAS